MSSDMYIIHMRSISSEWTESYSDEDHICKRAVNLDKMEDEKITKILHVDTLSERMTPKTIVFRDGKLQLTEVG